MGRHTRDRVRHQQGPIGLDERSSGRRRFYRIDGNAKTQDLVILVISMNVLTYMLYFENTKSEEVGLNGQNDDSLYATKT